MNHKIIVSYFNGQNAFVTHLTPHIDIFDLISGSKIVDNQPLFFDSILKGYIYNFTNYSIEKEYRFIIDFGSGNYTRYVTGGINKRDFLTEDNFLALK